MDSRLTNYREPIEARAYEVRYDSSYQTESGASSLRDYIEIIFRRKIVIVAVFTLVMVITIAYTFTRTPLYESSATLEIGEISGIGKPKAYVNPKQRLDKEVGMLKSRGLAEEYVSRIEPRPEDSETLSPQLLSNIKLSESDGQVQPGRDIHEILSMNAAYLTPQQAQLAGILTSMVSVKPEKGNALFLKVGVRTDEPELSWKILRNYVRLYLENDLERSRRESRQAALWLEDELKKSETKLRESQSELFVFNLENGITDDEKGKSFSFSSLNKSFEGLEQSKQAQTKMQALQQHEGRMLPQGVNNEYIGKLKQDIALMESEHAQMQGVYSANYPKMVLVRQKIKFLQDKVREMERQVVESSLQVAKTEQNLLEEHFEKAKGETDRIKSLEAHHTLLKKEVENNTEFHKILLKEFKEIDIRARTLPNNAHLVDPPTLPTSPAWPNKPLFLSIGFLVGIVGGFGIAVVLDRLDSTLHSPMHLENQLGVRKLGVVPNAGRIQELKALPGDESSLALTAYYNPRTPMSDSIKNIQASMYFSHMENPPRRIMLTSAAPGEGKTTISVSMSTILTSEGDRRVVLVDCDLRRPRVHKVLGNGDSTVGLADYLLDSSMKVEEIIKQHSISGLFYVTAGSIEGDPVKMLSSVRMKNLVDSLSDEFDYLVMDAPPMLGFPDSLLVSSLSDGVVFVVKHASSSKYDVQEALDLLRSVQQGVRILGVVMNQFKAPNAYGYKYRYGGYYYRNQKYYSDKGSRS